MTSQVRAILRYKSGAKTYVDRAKPRDLQDRSSRELATKGDCTLLYFYFVDLNNASSRACSTFNYALHSTMAFTWPSSLQRPELHFHAFEGFQITHLPSLRAFPRANASWKHARLARQLPRCSASELAGAPNFGDGLPTAHIAALDNRASSQDLLRLLRLKQPGEHMIRRFTCTRHCMPFSASRRGNKHCCLQSPQQALE